MDRRKTLNTSSPSTPKLLRLRDSLNICDIENDDEAEKRERQKIKLLELQQKSSPQRSADPRLSVSNVISGLTNAQLAEHYTNCIKLSSENKITMKNAFNLHLIDYMQSMIMKKNSEMDNFQVASCTLDASTKIYASRVDYVHAETFKIAGGFSKQSKKNKNLEEDAENEGDGNEGEDGPTPVKRRKVRKKNTIEQNLKNLNLNKIDEEYTFDPLYQKMRHTFDEGGTSSLLLSTLSSKNDGSELQFDSKAPAFPPATELSTKKPHINIDLTSINDILLKITKEDKQICPEFAEFTFLNWNPQDDNSKQNVAPFPAVNSSLVYNNESIHEQMDENDDDYGGGGDDGGGMEDFQNSDNEGKAETDFDRLQNEKLHSNQKTRGGMDLLNALSMEPSEYSYFSVDALRTWAGADHWHLHPGFQTNKKVQGQPRKVKEAFSVKFSEENFEDEFRNSKRSSQLTKRTLNEIWSKKKTTLPPDLHYKAEELHKLFLKSKLKIKKKACSLHVDDAIEQYDYENANDCENYCPANTVPENLNHSDDLFSNDFSSFDETAICNNAAFADNNLVQQPYKVEKISVQYAKTAKKIDVQKLKRSMWKLLKQDVPENEIIENNMNFTSLYKKLPSQVTGKTLENLSVPIAFVCLLYLANEKELEITNLDNLADLVIKC